MSAFRIAVRTAAGDLRHGTGWLLAADLAVTAFHVVGESAARAWIHEGPDADAKYVGIVPSSGSGASPAGELVLEPAVFDVAADVALLRVKSGDTSGIPVLQLVERTPAKGAAWESPAYPEFHGGAPFTLSGSITELRGDDARGAIQLLIAQGAQVAWNGVSGAVVCVEGRAAGVVTDVTDGTATAWAASAQVVRRLVERLASSAASGPGSAGSAGGSGGSGGSGIWAGLWRGRSSEVLQGLRDPDSRGVALLEPLGFRARQVIDEAMATLRRTEGESLLPLVLVPDRGGDGEEHLYESLREGMRAELERALGRPLPGPWRVPFDDNAARGTARDRFEQTFMALLRGPARQSSRVLVLLVDGLARVPQEQMRRWGELMHRLAYEQWRLVVWGGQGLHELLTKTEGDSSAFHNLRVVNVKALKPQEVQQLALDRLKTSQPAPVLTAATAGHPALVHELLDQFPDDVRAADAEALQQRVPETIHVDRIRRELERDTEALKELRVLSGMTGDKLARAPGNRAQDRLKWLGVIADGGPGKWVWTAPVMRTLADEIG